MLLPRRLLDVGLQTFVKMNFLVSLTPNNVVDSSKQATNMYTGFTFKISK